MRLLHLFGFVTLLFFSLSFPIKASKSLEIDDFLDNQYKGFMTPQFKFGVFQLPPEVAIPHYRIFKKIPSVGAEVWIKTIYDEEKAPIAWFMVAQDTKTKGALITEVTVNEEKNTKACFEAIESWASSQVGFKSHSYLGRFLRKTQRISFMEDPLELDTSAYAQAQTIAGFVALEHIPNIVGTPFFHIRGMGKETAESSAMRNRLIFYYNLCVCPPKLINLEEASKRKTKHRRVFRGLPKSKL